MRNTASRRRQKIDLGTRPELLDLVERDILTEDAAREVVMNEKRQDEAKKRDELQMLFASVHKSPITIGSDGRWRTRIPDENGKLKLRAKTTLEAIEKELRRAYFQDDMTDSERELTTLEILYPKWLEKKRNNKDEPISLSTIERYESDWKNKILPNRDIVSVPIRRLTKEKLKSWSDELFDEVSISYYTNIKTVITGILSLAVEKGIISSEENPAQAMVRKEAKKYKMMKAVEEGVEWKEHEIEAYTPEEIAKLEKTALWIARNHKKISNPALFYGIAFWIYTGLRPGEILALKFEDLSDGLLSVSRMYCYHEDIKDEKGNRTKAIIKPWVKNYKVERSFAISHEAIAIMEECRAMKSRKRYKSQFAFSIDNKPVTHNKLMKAVKICCRIAGVEYKRPYAFRDTWITTLVDSGKFTLREIADMAGNSPQVIMEHYYGNRRQVVNDVNYMSDALKGLKI